MENPSRRDGSPPLKGMRVLVVEDDYILALELESILTGAGADIAGLCTTVEDALPRAKGNNLSAAILDFRIGRKTVDCVARNLSSRGVPFVFYTGQAETGSIQSQWPQSKVIKKPAQPQTIIRTLAEMAGRRPD